MDGYGKRILVIDEDAGCQAFLEAQLEQKGYAVQTACDGVAGLDEMRKRRFDAVIAGCHMPGLNGIEFAEFSGITWPDTPIILVSYDLNDLTDDAEEYGTVTCIRKPYEATLLLSLLRTAIQPVSSEHTTYAMAELNY
jgi:DNA-binding response OmpR family regulator